MIYVYTQQLLLITICHCCQFLFLLSSVLLDTTFSRFCFFFVTVACPCSSTTKCHVNLFVNNNNNNNNNNMRICVPRRNHAIVALHSRLSIFCHSHTYHVRHLPPLQYGYTFSCLYYLFTHFEHLWQSHTNHKLKFSRECCPILLVSCIPVTLLYNIMQQHFC